MLFSRFQHRSILRLDAIPNTCNDLYDIQTLYLLESPAPLFTTPQLLPKLYIWNRPDMFKQTLYFVNYCKLKTGCILKTGLKLKSDYIESGLHIEILC